MSESLKNKTVRGVTWSLIDNIANSGITFLVGLILARLLTPAEYGIMAMIAIFIAISTSIIDSGFSNALIRKNAVKKIDYDTVFYFNLVVSSILYIFLYLVSPAISSFFKEPVLIEVTRVISWILIINALGIIPRTIFIINVDFKVQTKASLISSLVSGIVGISMALFGLGVWSLVGQQLSRQLLNTFFLWFYCHWRPAWEFSIESFKEMFGFGSKLLVSGLIDTIYKNISIGKDNCTREEVENAAKAAQIHSFIQSLPDGYDTYLGSAGIKLSGGEKQRICIARAILKGAPIIVFDEATSFTDIENEHKIQIALENLLKGKTTIMIAHRLHTIVNADNICVFQNGSIVEMGCHTDLLEKNGVYAEMWCAYTQQGKEVLHK